MAINVNVKFRNNDSFTQYVFTIMDLVLNTAAVDPNNNAIENYPLAPGESVVAKLCLGTNGHGQANYWYNGGVVNHRDDLNDGDEVDMV